ncbi:hypothetical protein BH18ACT2_BH18ACT2_10280 [soil metagenome]
MREALVGLGGDEPSFWPAFWPDFAATSAGVLLGALAAWEIERWVRRHEERTIASASEDRRRQVAATIVSWLDGNAARLHALWSDLKEDEVQVYPEAEAGLDLETWEMVRADVVALVSDPALRARLGRSFERLERIARLTDRLRDRIISAYGDPAALQDPLIVLFPALVHELVAAAEVEKGEINDLRSAVDALT